MRARLRALRAVVTMLVLLHYAGSHAAELIVLSSGASRSAISVLGPVFEKEAKQTVSIRFANNPVLEKMVSEGAAVDVLIIEPDYIDRLTAGGHIVQGSRMDLARVGMALGGRLGTPMVDTTSVEAFVRVLRDIESIAYTADGHSGTVFLRTLERLGIAEAMKDKLRPAVGRTASSLVLAGQAQIWAGPISTPAKGAQVIGRFPEPLQTYIGISAGIGARSHNREAAAAFIAFLRSSQAVAAFTDKGFEHVAQ